MITKQELDNRTLHIRELWDKLDPRDRDVLLRRSDLDGVDTLCDWKALNEDSRSSIVRWFYR